MTIHRLGCVATILLAACGGDGDGGGDGADAAVTSDGDVSTDADVAACSSGNVVGMVPGYSIDPALSVVATETKDGNFVLGLSEEALAGCYPEAEDGSTLVFQWDDPPAVGEYEVALGEVMVGWDRSGDVIAVGVDGEVSVTASDESCVRGSYSVDLEHDLGVDHVTGGFNATVCGG